MSRTLQGMYADKLETENKQLREALHTTRKVLEEEIATKKKAIEYIEENCVDYETYSMVNADNVIKILQDDTITLNTKDMNITGGKYER